MDLEIPLGKRTKRYRFLEMLPGLISYGAVILLVVLSLISPVAASAYLLMVILSALVKVVGICYRTITGRQNMERVSAIDWHQRLTDLEDPKQSYSKLRETTSKQPGYEQHLENLRLMAAAEKGYFPKPSDIYNVLIMPAYNEGIEVIEPAVQSILDSAYDIRRLIVIFAYEERGGADIEKTARTLQRRYKNHFHSFHIVKHPDGIPDEVIGKGGNITYAGKWAQQYLQEQHIKPSNVIVTTMDCDNRPHPKYFDYLTYEYIVHEDRKHLSYQPICLFTNNIWDVPAPMRVIATGNSFWNIIVSTRPYALRNFASHSQPMDALIEMNFWSTRTIVEDGHQYWRSYFHFGGNYDVLPIYVPIYQDAVLSNSYYKTLKAQFVQLRRWAYGASDVAYVGDRVFSSKRNTPFWPSFTRFVRLLDGHVTLAAIAILIAFGGWVPLLVNGESIRSVAAHQLPDTVSVLQRIAMIGLAVSIFSSFKILPPRPERYKRRRNVFMVLQWVLMPITSIVYNSMAAYYSHTRLLFGKYLDKFDVTDKAVATAVDQKKSRRQNKK